MAKKTARRKAAQVGLELIIVLLLSSMALPGTGSVVFALAPTPEGNLTGPKVVQFSGSGIQKTLPPGTVEQIDLRLSGADYPGCIDQPETPVVDFRTDDLDLTGIAIIATCGWKANETVKVTLVDPQGKTSSTVMKTVPAKYGKDVYEAVLYYQPGVDAPEGKYRFTLEGSATVKAKVNFHRTEGARLYAVSGDPFKPLVGATGGQQRLRLQGFVPNEPIRLLAYTFQGTEIKFTGWQDYNADHSGRLIVETDVAGVDKDTEMNYFAFGHETHFIPLERFTTEGFSITHQMDMELYCPGAQAPRLSAAQNIRAAPGVDRLNIHQQPGYGSYRIAENAAGLPAAAASMRVYGYPKCIDHAFWWKVSLTKPVLFGWVAESYLGKYQVEPSP